MGSDGTDNGMHGDNVQSSRCVYKIHKIYLMYLHIVVVESCEAIILVS